MKQSAQKTAEGILFTDQYQLTMAQLYFRYNLHEQQVQFAQIVLRHLLDHTKYRVLEQPDLAEIEPLLVDVLRDGKLVYELLSIEEIR